MKETGSYGNLSFSKKIDLEYLEKRFLSMTAKDLNEIKAAIKYMDYKPTILSKFFNVKSLLFKEIADDPDFYKAETIFPNPLNDNKIVKCINILNAKYTKDLVKADLTASESLVPSPVAELLKGVRLINDHGAVGLKFTTDFKGDVYLNIPRGNEVELKDVEVKDVTFNVMNVFNTYLTEGFTLALRDKENDTWVSIEPYSLDGIKGSGELYVFVKIGNSFYRDLAIKYFDPEEILNIYRG